MSFYAGSSAVYHISFGSLFHALLCPRRLKINCFEGEYWVNKKLFIINMHTMYNQNAGEIYHISQITLKAAEKYAAETPPRIAISHLWLLSDISKFFIAAIADFILYFST